jgi:hypothetical protein
MFVYFVASPMQPRPGFVFFVYFVAAFTLPWSESQAGLSHVFGGKAGHDKLRAAGVANARLPFSAIAVEEHS